ncbi:hypothetical protein [Geminicoccus roseus]|uniref:hypothetical protein n=1 Tax=Geminicoccus roseus TaxID=404900 RepID=UPI0004239EAC|nr:hypothetical protein [Geminicoccus roseus]
MDQTPPIRPKRKPFPLPTGPLWLDRLQQSCLVILLVNWVFQGMRGMQRKELGFRLGFGAAIAALCGGLAAGAGLPPLAALAVGVFSGHSVNFLANGQFWVCARYCRRYRGSAARIAAASVALASELAALPWLDEVAFIGSRARGGEPSDRSDIDLRLVFPPGVRGWWRTNLLLLRLRSRALVQGLPLDLYAYDAPDALLRFDQDEPLLLAKDSHGRLRRMFARRAVDLEARPAAQRRPA